jgi:hypothetical protein
MRKGISKIIFNSIRFRANKKQRNCCVVVCVGVFLMMSAISCQQMPSSQKNSFRLPDESLEGDFFYLDEPVLLDNDKFNICLDTQAEQLTVLYLRADASRDDRIKISDEQIRKMSNAVKFDFISLREVQKDYYRYGVLVLMIDRGQQASWKNFKRTLEAVKANFRVAYLANGDDDFLKSFLMADLSPENEVWLIDSKRDVKIKLDYPITQAQLELRIEQMLQARYTPGAKLCF